MMANCKQFKLSWLFLRFSRSICYILRRNIELLLGTYINAHCFGLNSQAFVNHSEFVEIHTRLVFIRLIVYSVKTRRIILILHRPPHRCAEMKEEPPKHDTETSRKEFSRLSKLLYSSAFIVLRQLSQIKY